MLLPADAVGFAQPGEHFRIHLLRRVNAEVMDVIARGERLDLCEAGIVQSSRQDYVRVQPIPFQEDIGKRHPHLKSDSRFIGNQDDRAAPPDQLHKSPVQRECQRTLALQVFANRDPRAEMKLIAVREKPLAPPALPEWTLRHGQRGVYRNFPTLTWGEAL